MALPSLTLVGPGRAGRAFVRSWVGAGGTATAVSEGPAALLEGFLRRRRPGGPRRRDRVRRGRLAPSARCRFAFHLSGALASDTISPLRAAGAAIGSFHPLRAFRGEEGEDARRRLRRDRGRSGRLRCRGSIRPGARRVPASDREGRKAALPRRGDAGGGGLGRPPFRGHARVGGRGDPRAGRPCRPGPARRGRRRGGGRPAVRRGSHGAHRAARPRNGAFTPRRALENSPELRRLYVLLARETLARTPGPDSDDALRALLTC